MVKGDFSHQCNGWTSRRCVFHVFMFMFVFFITLAGTEEIRTVSGNQTTLDLRDLTVGVSYGVSVTALVGENEGDQVTVYIKPGDMMVMWFNTITWWNICQTLGLNIILGIFGISFVSEQSVGKVSNLRVIHANSRKIRISWTGLTEATGYKVTWRQGNSKLSHCLNHKTKLFSEVFFYFFDLN